MTDALDIMDGILAASRKRMDEWTAGREGRLESAVRELRAERNALTRLREARQALNVVRDDYRAAKRRADQALKDLGDI